MKKQKALTAKSQTGKVKGQTPSWTKRNIAGRSPATGPKGASRGIFVRKNRKNVLTKNTASSRMKVQTPVVGRKEHCGAFLCLIDGENFVHGLVKKLKKQGLVRNRQDLTKINFSELLDMKKFSSVNYYATTVRLPKKGSSLFKAVDKVIKWNDKWVPYIANQGVKYIKAGYLRVRDGKKCQKCGESMEVLVEKGVDVKIAVDLVANARSGATIYLFSSDTDLLPAINMAVERGAKVVYVAFSGTEIGLLSKHCSETKLISNAAMKRAFKEVR